MTEGPFVTNLTEDQVLKFKADLVEQGFEFSQANYAIFAAKKKGVNLTLYASLKLVVQGKEKDEFISFYLEPEILKNFSYTHQMAYVDLGPRIGIDEAGKGDFFGPLCIAGVYADAQSIEKLVSFGVVDSKKLNDIKIEKIAKEIRKHLIYTVVQLFPEKYNELYPKFGNLNSMLAWGHASCIETLMRQTKCETVIIDQFASSHVVENALKRKNLNPHLTQRHHGEGDIVVAAASILARDAFVQGMKKMSDQIGVTLPKGAGSIVKQIAKRLYVEHGEQWLATLVKTHFKTFAEVKQID